MLAPRALVTTEAPAAPILLTLYQAHGPVGRVELSPRSELHLAADVIIHATSKSEAEQ